MAKKPEKLFKPGDILLGISLIIIGYLIFFWFKPFSGSQSKALIQIDNNLRYEVNLEKNQIFSLKEFNPAVVIEVHNKAIRIIRNDCDKKICLKMGFISKPGQVIVCVPKKILIYIPANNEQNQIIKAITG
jgi:hypothetical protein